MRRFYSSTPNFLPTARSVRALRHLGKKFGTPGFFGVVFCVVSAAVLVSVYAPSLPASAIQSGLFTHTPELPGEPETSDETPQGPALLDASVTDTPTLVIEKIGVDMKIVEGKTEKVLLDGAWRSPWSSTPDQNGNTVLFGHRWLHKPPHPETFWSLDKLTVGDTFTVSWRGTTYTYTVVETKVVAPSEVSVLAPTARPSVTLITCTPLFTTKQRLVVRAERVGS